VLLPSDTHRKPITSITAVLLPSVTYLLTLPRMSVFTLFMLSYVGSGLFFSYGATAPIGASAYLNETFRFTSVFYILDSR
jgi:Flp pilus assembly protein TadG